MRVPKMVGLQFTMENPIKIDDLGVPLFQETTMWYPHVDEDSMPWRNPYQE